jgi:hypothetical protein
MQPYGQWAWVHQCDVEPDLMAKSPGEHEGGAFALPPGFAARLQSTGLLGRVNRRFGTLLDFYEEEDIASPAVLYFIAGCLQESFIGHELHSLVGELVGVILNAADAHSCLTFRL